MPCPSIHPKNWTDQNCFGTLEGQDISNFKKMWEIFSNLMPFSQYLNFKDEGTWVLAEGFIPFVAKVLTSKDIPSEGKIALMRYGILLPKLF